MPRGALDEALRPLWLSSGGVAGPMAEQGVRPDRVARGLERVRAGPVAAEVLAAAILWGPPPGSFEAGMLPRDRE